MGIYEHQTKVSEVISDDGELLREVVNTVYIVKGNSRYVSMYDYRFIYNLSGVASGLLFWMGLDAKFNTNLIMLEEEYIEKNLRRLRIGNMRRFKKLIKELESDNLIFRRSQWSWIINPMVIFRGSQKARKDLIKELIEQGKDLKYGSSGDSKES